MTQYLHTMIRVADPDATAYNFYKSSFVLRVFAMAPVREVFSPARLLPNRNGVRADVPDNKKSRKPGADGRHAVGVMMLT